MKLPPQAKRVFQGIIFDVYQWEQELYDGTKTTFEALKRPDTVQVIATAGDSIFIPFEEQPHYSRKYTFLGGRVEPGEDPLTAAKRELLEEAGLESTAWEHFKTYPIGGKIEWNIHLYIAKNCQKIAEQRLDPGGKIEIKRVTYDEFLAIVTDETFGDVQFANDMFRIKENPAKLESFKQALF